MQEMVSSPLSRKSRWYPIKVLKSDGTEVSCVWGVCGGGEWCGAMCMVVLCAWGAWRLHGARRMWVGCAGCVWCDCAGCKVATGAAAMAMKGQSIGGYKVVEVQVMEVEDGEKQLTMSTSSNFSQSVDMRTSVETTVVTTTVVEEQVVEAKRKEIFGDPEEVRADAAADWEARLAAVEAERDAMKAENEAMKAEKEARRKEIFGDPDEVKADATAEWEARLAVVEAERDAARAELQVSVELSATTPGGKGAPVVGGPTGGYAVQLRVKAQLEGDEGEVCVGVMCSGWGLSMGGWNDVGVLG